MENAITLTVSDVAVLSGVAVGMCVNVDISHEQMYAKLEHCDLFPITCSKHIAKNDLSTQHPRDGRVA